MYETRRRFVFSGTIKKKNAACKQTRSRHGNCKFEFSPTFEPRLQIRATAAIRPITGRRVDEICATIASRAMRVNEMPPAVPPPEAFSSPIRDKLLREQQPVRKYNAVS
jgi:hypothetical protein